MLECYYEDSNNTNRRYAIFDIKNDGEIRCVQFYLNDETGQLNLGFDSLHLSDEFVYRSWTGPESLYTHRCSLNEVLTALCNTGD
jgi:hypothetical protein